MNEQNLRPPFSPEEAREYGKKGAAKSAIVRKEKSKTRKTLESYLDSKIEEPKQLELAQKYGVKKRHPTQRDFLVAMVTQRVARKGNFNDLEKMMDLIGESADRQAENGMLADLIDGLRDEI